jgi:hypothetical protein
MTIGIALVAWLAAVISWLLIAAMTSTRAATSSRASAGNRSGFPSP